jgi:hypothetical protein
MLARSSSSVLMLYKSATPRYSSGFRFASQGTIIRDYIAGNINCNGENRLSRQVGKTKGNSSYPFLFAIDG